MEEISDQSFFRYCVLTLIFSGPPTALKFLQAPYGKHNRTGFGTTVSPPIAWFVMESPTLWLMLLLFPVTVATLAFTFNLLNGYIQARWVSHYKNDYEDTQWFRGLLSMADLFGSGDFTEQDLSIGEEEDFKGKMTSSSGARFSLNAKDYELLEKVGDDVYRARCILLDDEIVAIKIWNLEKCTNDLETIRNEVHKTSLIDHPNLLRPHCCFLDGCSLWIVMPYMSCGSCLNIVKSVYPQGLEEPVIANLLREILKALVYLHEQGHIHGDIKAGNILVDSEGTVKLGDFEVSACKFDSVERIRTSSGNTFVAWNVPEDMQQVDGYDFKVDIWSFGITALQLAHGHGLSHSRLFQPRTVLPMTLQNSPCPDYDEKKFSKSFSELVAACLVKDPENRPTAAKLLEHPFFEHACSTEYLSRTILVGLSPLGQRYRELKDKQKNDEELLASGQLASPVNLDSCDAAQILPLLQNLLIQNDIQRERLIGLIQLYDPTAEIGNPVVNMEGGQISTTETELLSEIHVLQQSIEKLEEEVEKQKTQNAQLEEHINRLMESRDP